jgi:WD40 repeat protein
LRALAFLPDSRTLVTGGKDGAVRLWDVTAARGVPGHTHLLNSYGLPGRGRFEAQAFARGTLDPRIVHRFGITFTPDGRSVLMPDRDGFVDARAVRSAQRTGRLTALGSNNWDVALSPDGRWLAAGDITGNITVWDWPARRAVTRFALPFEWCGRLSFSRGGRFLLAVTILHNHKANWRILRTEDWQDVPLPDLLWKDLVSAVVSPDERRLATGYENGAVRLWRFPTGQLDFACTNHAKRVVVVLFSPDGRTLITSGDDDQVRFWDVAARWELGPYPGLAGGYGAAFSADGRRLVTGPGGRDAVKLWDLATRRELLSLHAQGQYFFGFGFAPDGDTLMAISLDGHVHLWRAPSWEEIGAAEQRSVAP